jgi:chemotaxis protein CheD
MHVSSNRDDVIITHALGSCLGIVIHDPVANVGGMLHVMLPQSTIDPKKGEESPFMFVDTGVPRLFKESYKAGADKQRLIVRVAGGAAVNKTEEHDYFQIGKRNVVALRNLLWKNGVLLKSFDVGGSDSRNMSINIATGEVTVTSKGKTTIL